MEDLCIRHNDYSLTRSAPTVNELRIFCTDIPAEGGVESSKRAQSFSRDGEVAAGSETPQLRHGIVIPVQVFDEQLTGRWVYVLRQAVDGIPGKKGTGMECETSFKGKEPIRIRPTVVVSKCYAVASGMVGTDVAGPGDPGVGNNPGPNLERTSEWT
jgi:hypothetical protein